MVDPHLQYWLATFGIVAGSFIMGWIYGYWIGRNSKILGELNLEPIYQLPET
jgi:hypothetical protein